MKISPLANPYNAVAPSQSTMGDHNTGTHNIRSLKMNTNATPPYERPNPQIAELPDVQKLPISNSNEGATKVDEETQPLSPQFAALAKQRRDLQKRQKELEDREKALSDPGREKIDLARLKSEPLRVLLEDAGFTWEQLTEQVSNYTGNSQLHTIERKMKDLEEGFESKLSERDQQAERQVLAEMTREAKMLSEQGDDFELIRGMNKIPDVMRLIEQTYKKSGDVLDVREAMQLIEDELLNDVEKVTSLKKVQSKFAPAQPYMQQHQGMRTLTNRDTASVPMSPKQRAMAAFYGQMQK